MSWHKPVRVAVAVFGVAAAVAVYFAIGSRQTASRVRRFNALDPKAMLEEVRRRPAAVTAGRGGLRG
jgi:hypothetical protein